MLLVDSLVVAIVSVGGEAPRLIVSVPSFCFTIVSKFEINHEAISNFCEKFLNFKKFNIYKLKVLRFLFEKRNFKLKVFLVWVKWMCKNWKSFGCKLT